MPEESAVQIVRRALETERRGHRFYARAAERTSDVKARRMFEQLARDEHYHEELIEDLYRDLLVGEGAEDGAEAQAFPIFAGVHPQEDLLAGMDDEAAVLRAAVEVEERARDFYGRAADRLGPGRAREVFLDLREMEEGHVRLLQAELDFVEKSGFYFDHREFTVEGERE